MVMIEKIAVIAAFGLPSFQWKLSPAQRLPELLGLCGLDASAYKKMGAFDQIHIDLDKWRTYFFECAEEDAVITGWDLVLKILTPYLSARDGKVLYELCDASEHTKRNHHEREYLIPEVILNMRNADPLDRTRAIASLVRTGEDQRFRRLLNSRHRSHLSPEDIELIQSHRPYLLLGEDGKEIIPSRNGWISLLLEDRVPTAEQFLDLWQNLIEENEDTMFDGERRADSVKLMAACFRSKFTDHERQWGDIVEHKTLWRHFVALLNALDAKNYKAIVSRKLIDRMYYWFGNSDVPASDQAHRQCVFFSIFGFNHQMAESILLMAKKGAFSPHLFRWLEHPSLSTEELEAFIQCASPTSYAYAEAAFSNPNVTWKMFLDAVKNDHLNVKICLLHPKVKQKLDPKTYQELVRMRYNITRSDLLDIAVNCSQHTISAILCADTPIPTSHQIALAQSYLTRQFGKDSTVCLERDFL